MSAAMLAADAALTEVSQSFDFLLAVTPVDSDTAWKSFCETGVVPPLTYRPLPVDPAQARMRLAAIKLDDDTIGEPLVAQLLRDKQRELDLQLGLLTMRDTPAFLTVSRSLYPDVDPVLLGEARAILETVPASIAAPSAREPSHVVSMGCDANAIAARARAELDRYRATYPALSATVHVRDDVASLQVSHGDLLVPARMVVPPHRVDALLQHEVGTHVVTYANGRSQPLRIFSSGLAAYEELQEGLAMIGEYASGGLDADRLRLIAARVVAVHMLVAGATFADVVGVLNDEHRIGKRTAFGIALRVFRGGGLTKDAIYLRGLLQLLAYLRDGGDIAPLLVGKIGFAHIPVVTDLVARGVLHAGALTPRWLGDGNADRLARLRVGLSASDLVEIT